MKNKINFNTSDEYLDFVENLKNQEEIIKKIKSSQNFSSEKLDNPDIEFYSDLNFLNQNSELINAIETMKTIANQNPLNINTDSQYSVKTEESLFQVIVSKFSYFVIGLFAALIVGGLWISRDNQSTQLNISTEKIAHDPGIINKTMVKSVPVPEIRLVGEEGTSAKLGINYYKNRDYENAKYEFFLEKQNTHESWFYNELDYYLAICQFKDGNLKESKKLFENLLIKEDFEHTEIANLYLGVIAFYMEDYTKAREYFTLQKVMDSSLELNDVATNKISIKDFAKLYMNKMK